MRTKHTFRLPPDLAAQLADYANRKRVPQALVVETALSSHLSPDNSERMEAALGRRLDRLTRQVERLERHVTISNEALALFVRFWLTSTHHCRIPRNPLPRPRAVSATKALSRRLAVGWRRDGRSPRKFLKTWFPRTGDQIIRMVLPERLRRRQVFLRQSTTIDLISLRERTSAPF
jgi:predicted transcriptional regulator